MSNEEKIDEKLDKGLKVIKEKHPELSISIDPTNVTKLIETHHEEKKTLEEQLEEERTLREDYELKLKLVAEQAFEHRKKELNAPSWIKDPETLKDWAESEGKISVGSGGSVSLRPEDVQKEYSGSGQKEFSSHEEMIDYLRQKAKIDPNGLEASQLKQLWQKVPLQTMGKELYEGKDCLKKVLDAQNREERRKHGYKEGES
jgi:hypothetical protein